MAEISLKDKTIRVKVIYYGPALGGKTTNLRVLHERAARGRRGEMWSINSFQDRTILFDLLPLHTVGPQGFDLRVQLLAVPGQAMYTASRRTALRGADAVVFVANSADDRLDENVRSLREMNRYLVEHQLDPAKIPLALQYNKRDLPRVLSIEDLNRALNERRDQIVPSVATSGHGVLETLELVLARTFVSLAGRFKGFEPGEGKTAETWSRQILTGIFAPPAESPRPAPVAPPASPQTKIRVAIPESPVKDEADSDRRSAEAYAEACTALAAALSDATMARDEARSRLAEVRRAVDVANAWSASDLAGSIRRMLSCFAEAAEASHASFVSWQEPQGASQVVLLPPFDEDPLVTSALGRGYLLRAVRNGVVLADDVERNLDIRALLDSSEPAFTGLVAIPIALPKRPLGIALLYFADGDRLAGESLLQHLGLLSSIFVTPLALALMAPPVRSAAASELKREPTPAA